MPCSEWGPRDFHVWAAGGVAFVLTILYLMLHQQKVRGWCINIEKNLAVTEAAMLAAPQK